MTKKMKFRHLGALVVVLALVAAACGDDDAGTTTTAATGATTAATAAPVAFPPEAGAWGGVLIEAGAPVEIRTMQALADAVAFLGVDQVRGTELAMEDYGDILGHPVNLGTTEDDLCLGEGGAAGATNIAAQEGVLGVIGTTCSGAAYPAIPILNAAGIVLISGSNTNATLTSDFQGNAGENWMDNYLRTAHNDLIQGAAAAIFAYDNLGLRAMGTIHDGDPYTSGLAAQFGVTFTELGGEIVVATSVAKEDTDMVPVLTEVATGEPDGIYFPIFQPAGDFIIQQVGGVAGLENVQMYGADGLITPDHFSIPETAGVYYSGPDLGFDANAGFTGESYSNLVVRYEAAYGELPTAAFHAHTYDATMMLLHSIESVAVEGPNGELWVDRRALRDFLYGLSDFPGVTGTLSCDDFGDCGGNVVSVILNEDPSDPQAGIANVVFRAGKGAGGEVVILPLDG
ncbi:MAG: branched-chain amino acid ABC transporter substrate-binding protein [Acidimicrobiia bacterium]